jgi:pyrimidine operon attenuation protein/uracil phosphoribosyltransferase
VPIARRIAGYLGEVLGQAVPVGAVDITLYRDDFGRSDHWPVLRGTDIRFAFDGAEIVWLTTSCTPVGPSVRR